MRAEKDGIFLLDYHLDRLKNSAAYFNYVFHEDKIRLALKKCIEDIVDRQKIRLLLAEDGTFKIEQYPLSEIKTGLKVALARQAVNSNNPFLYHKTTQRLVYQPAAQQAEMQNVDDVIMFNENGEITEAVIANVVIQKNNVFYTPPLHCGLLNGTFRQYLLQHKKIEEKTLFPEDLQQADGLFLINSLKKWQKVSLQTL
jgi:para-aminobenzoate synthetase/4-amino-4-deoxychorismate lyase